MPAAWAQQPGATVDPAPPETAGPEQVITAPQDEGVDPCPPPELTYDTFVDRVNRRLYHTVCGTSRWFDGFFGDDRAYDESLRTFGHVNLGMLWTDRDGVDPRLRSRIHLDLPNVERRLYAFIGRVDRDAFLSDTEEYVDTGLSTSEERDFDWLLGIGYTPIDRGRRRLNLSAGVRVSWPPDPYVKAQYRWHLEPAPDWLFRWRQTVFWTGDERFGTTTGLDLEHRLSDNLLARLSGSGTISEVSVGVEWWSTLTLFQGLGGNAALAWQLRANGATDSPVPLREYGARVTYRRRLHRVWLFGEIGTGVFWPQDEDELERDVSPEIWLAVEMHFGTERAASDRR
jgi:hypothetical protein